MVTSDTRVAKLQLETGADVEVGVWLGVKVAAGVSVCVGVSVSVTRGVAVGCNRAFWVESAWIV